MSDRNNQLRELLSRTEPAIATYSRHYYGAHRVGLLRRHLWHLARYRQKYLYWCFLRITRQCRLVSTQTFWGQEIWLTLPDKEGRKCYFTGFITPQELPLVKHLIRVLRPGDIFFDGGANYGFYSLLASEFLKPGDVHAFEPNPEILPALERNIQKIGARLNSVALSRTPGESTFHSNDIMFGSQSGSITLGKKSTEHAVKVRCESLDNYCQTQSVIPSFIKLDIEGAETMVLEGAQNLLRNHRPNISLEVWNGDLGSNYSMNAVTTLKSFGYSAHRIEADGSLKRVDLTSADQVQGRYENFLFAV